MTHPPVPILTSYRALYSQGKVLMGAGLLKDSVEAYSRCFRIRQQAHPNHPTTAFLCHQLGVLAEKMNDRGPAE